MKIMFSMMGCAMISKEKVRQMTKLAAFEEREGKSCHKMTQFFRKDYVSMEMIKSFLTGTIAFAVIVGIWAVYRMEELMNEINKMDIPAFGIQLLMKYLVFMALYLLATYIIYNIRYSKGRRKIRQFYNGLKKISHLYESENRPGSFDDFE